MKAKGQLVAKGSVQVLRQPLICLSCWTSLSVSIRKQGGQPPTPTPRLCWWHWSGAPYSSASDVPAPVASMSPSGSGEGCCRGCGGPGAGRAHALSCPGCSLVPPPHGGVATAVLRALTRYLSAIRGLCTLPCGLSACGREHVHCRCCSNACLTPRVAYLFL